jgi:required for meiotic nuclear division protein 1
MFKVIATQISENINLESFQTAYTGELLYANYFELFYEVGTEQYISILKYGVVCFLNFDNAKINEFIKTISNHCRYFYDSELNKEYYIEPNAKEIKFGFNKAALTYCDIETMRLIMLNISQSVALDYYFQQSRILLEETNKHTSILEKQGKLAISDKNLKKFIGKTLNLKNQIVENLHIFDSIPETWQSDFLIKIDIELKEALYMERRSENIHEDLRIIREHLEYFSDILHHSASTKLELIVIVLVCIEVFDIIYRGYILK